MQRAGKIYKLIIITALFFILQQSLEAQVAIAVHDSTLPRGIIHEVPVYADFGSQQVNNIEIVFKFNALLLDIKKEVTTGPGYLIQDTPVVIIDYSDLTSATATLRSDNVTTGEGILCLLHLETLAGPDSVTRLTPEEVKINGNTISTAELQGGLFQIGIPIVPILAEYIGQNYPNPFFANTNIPFGIKKESKVKFYIYNTIGSLIDEIPGENSFGVNLFKDDVRIDFPEGSKLEPGDYIIMLTPVPWEVASGPYMILMETENGVYRTNFVFQK